jgi:hypothetical protein
MMNKLLTLIAACAIASTAFHSCTDKPPVPSNCGPKKAKFLTDGIRMMYWPTGGRSLDTALVFEYTEITPTVFRQTQKFIGHQPNGALPAWKDSVIKTQFQQCCGKDIVMQTQAFGIETNFGSSKNFYIQGSRLVNDKWEFTLDSVKYYMGCAQKNITYVDPPYLTGTIVADKLYMKTSPAQVPCDTIIWSDSLGILTRYNPIDAGKLLRLKYIR